MFKTKSFVSSASNKFIRTDIWDCDMEIILVRHGHKAAYHCFVLFCSWAFCLIPFFRLNDVDWNPNLTDAGYEQVKWVGKYLQEQNLKFDHIYVSPLRRTVQTALTIVDV